MTNIVIGRLLRRRSLPADEESHGVRMSQSGFLSTLLRACDTEEPNPICRS